MHYLASLVHDQIRCSMKLDVEIPAAQWFLGHEAALRVGLRVVLHYNLMVIGLSS